MKKHTGLWLVLAASLVSFDANAALVTYRFDGFVTEISTNENEIIPNLEIGDGFSGFTTFESNGYNGTDGIVFIVINGLDLLFDGPSIFGNAEAVFNTSYSIRIAGDTGGDIGDSTFSAFNFGPDLEDTDGSAGHNVMFPNELNLGEFEENIFRIQGTYRPTGDQISLIGQLNTFSIVPEPSSAVLAGLAMLTLIGKRNCSRN